MCKGRLFIFALHSSRIFTKPGITPTPRECILCTLEPNIPELRYQLDSLLSLYNPLVCLNVNSPSVKIVGAAWGLSSRGALTLSNTLERSGLSWGTSSENLILVDVALPVFVIVSISNPNFVVVSISVALE